MKKEERRKVPELRFKGFTDDWKECELGNAVTRLKSYSLSRKFETNDVTNFKYIHYGDIHTGKASKITNNSSLPFIEDDNYDTLTTGDVILTDASEDFMGIALPAILQDNSDDYSYVAGLHTIAIRPQNNIYPNFLYYSFLTNRFRKFGNQVGTGMKVFGINYNNLSKFELLFSSNINEQKYISKIINSLSKIIDAEQKKLNLILILKEFIILNLLTCDNYNFPIIRFSGFVNEWKKVKLEDIAYIVGGGTPSTKNSEFWNGNIDWYTPSEIVGRVYLNKSERTISKIGLKNSSAKVLPKNQSILFTSRATIGEASILKKEGATNQGFQSLVIKEKNNVYFVYSLKDKIKKEAIRKSSGSTFKEVSGKSMKSISIYVPDYYEQTKIGNILQTLDTIINNEHKKIERYTKIKSYLLDKLFI